MHQKSSELLYITQKIRRKLGVHNIGNRRGTQPTTPLFIPLDLLS